MTTKIKLGPTQLGLEEPMYFDVTVEEGRVAALDVIAGQAHRGMEHLVMQRNFFQNITLLERLCSLCSNSHPSTFCVALEEIAGIVVPRRAEFLRIIADEIKRIASHLFNIAILAHLAGEKPVFRRVMELREIVQESKETVYGNRMDLAANCIGGVRYDLDRDLTRYLWQQMERLKAPLDELYRLYEEEGPLKGRMEGVGVLPQAAAREFAVVGPVARASGIDYDVRVKAPYAAYDLLPVAVALRGEGDVRARALVRLREAQESALIIQRCLTEMPGGRACADVVPEIPAGEAISRSEAPRGELIYYLSTDGSDLPVRLKWRVPSYMNWDALKVMLVGSPVTDVPLVVNSIDPCISCTDR